MVGIRHLMKTLGPLKTTTLRDSKTSKCQVLLRTLNLCLHWFSLRRMATNLGNLRVDPFWPHGGIRHRVTPEERGYLNGPKPQCWANFPTAAINLYCSISEQH